MRIIPQSEIGKKVDCACGCGRLRNKYDKRGRERKYICGHIFKGRKHSEENKKKLRELKKGITWEEREGKEKSNIRKEKQRQFMKENNPMKNPIFVRRSKEARKESQKGLPKKLGNLNPNYKERIKKICKFCQKDFFVIPCYSYRKFCSHKCYLKYNTGKNHSMYGKKHSEEARIKQKQNNKSKTKDVRQKMSKTKKIRYKEGKIQPHNKNKTWEESYGEERAKKIRIQTIESGKRYFRNNPLAKLRFIEMRAKMVFPKKDTLIEVKLQNFLKQLNIKFFTHSWRNNIQDKYPCDIFIPSKNLVIECDGDFIHCNPLKYSSDFVRFPNSKKIITAQEIWDRDNLRTTQLLEAGYKVLRLWEHEIKVMKIEDFQDKIREVKNEEIKI